MIFNKQKQETNIVENPESLDIIEPDKPDKPDINDPELWTIIKNNTMPVLHSVVNSKQPIVNNNGEARSNKRKKDNDNSANKTKSSG